ncbi:PRTRC system protein E [Paraburkholderia sp. RP-4-7]|uniref:PRTRC system protein E n=1 Tax=Paraburkholderia polaris TaxID=2728848 RepID=A0A848IJU6_9BURK|nr:PRTRC system protein E [Paraburkholderia polaris]NMM01560.1 PRTRC system protein E [Paraburkholderia polaris]
MFQTLEALVRAISKLNLTLRMDGDQMVVVVVPMGEGKDAALRQPLIITGLPNELDEGFVAAVQSYSAAHRSLSEQVEATTAILQEAEKSQAGKGQKALQKKSTPALPAPSKSKPGPDDSDEDEDDDSGTLGDVGGTQVTDSNATATSPVPDASQGTDLQSLLI